MGLPSAHAGSRIHPIDRGRPLRRRLHGQLEIERVSRESSGAPATGRASRPAGADGSRRSRSRSAASSASPPTSRTTSRAPPAQAGRHKNGKRIALVGGGPASLAVARDLAPLGYHCVVFDQDPKAGGMIRTQIPRFRLPESVIDEECDYILDLGIEFLGGKRIDSLKALLAGRLGRDLRRLRRAARPRSRNSRPQGSRAPTSISASTGCRRSRSATSPRSASA